MADNELLIFSGRTFPCDFFLGYTFRHIGFDYNSLIFQPVNVMDHPFFGQFLCFIVAFKFHMLKIFDRAFNNDLNILPARQAA